jgi:hypothetical protein
MPSSVVSRTTFWKTDTAPLCGSVTANPVMSGVANAVVVDVDTVRSQVVKKASRTAMPEYGVQHVAGDSVVHLPYRGAPRTPSLDLIVSQVGRK